MADRGAAHFELVLDVAKALADPLQRRVGLPPAVGLYESLDLCPYRGGDLLFASTAHFPDLLPGSGKEPRAKFPLPPAYGVVGGPREPRDPCLAPTAKVVRFAGQIDSLLCLVEIGQEGLDLVRQFFVIFFHPSKIEKKIICHVIS